MREFYGKRVVVLAANGRVFEGGVEDCFFPEDNDGRESIVVKTLAGDLVEFCADDIGCVLVF